MEAQRVMEADLPGLEQAGFVDPWGIHLRGESLTLGVKILIEEGVTVLDVPPAVRSDQRAHAAVVQVRVLKRDPGGNHVGRRRDPPIGEILMPADVRRSRR